MPVFLLGMAGTYIKLSGAIYLDGVISTLLIGDELMPRLPFIPLDKESVSQSLRPTRPANRAYSPRAPRMPWRAQEGVR